MTRMTKCKPGNHRTVWRPSQVIPLDINYDITATPRLVACVWGGDLSFAHPQRTVNGVGSIRTPRSPT